MLLNISFGDSFIHSSGIVVVRVTMRGSYEARRIEIITGQGACLELQVNFTDTLRGCYCS